MTTHDDKELLVNNYGNEKLSLDTDYHENKLPARLLRVNEVARFLGVHSSTVRRWEKKGLLKSYPIGLRHNLRFKQEDVLDFLHHYQDEHTSDATTSGRLDRTIRNPDRKGGE